MNIDPDRESWDENRWAWDSETDREALHAARQRLAAVLHRQADARQDGLTTDAGPWWRRLWRSLIEGA